MRLGGQGVVPIRQPPEPLLLAREALKARFRNQRLYEAYKPAAAAARAQGRAASARRATRRRAGACHMGSAVPAAAHRAPSRRRQRARCVGNYSGLAGGSAAHRPLGHEFGAQRCPHGVPRQQLRLSRNGPPAATGPGPALASSGLLSPLTQDHKHTTESRDHEHAAHSIKDNVQAPGGRAPALPRAPPALSSFPCCARRRCGLCYKARARGGARSGATPTYRPSSPLHGHGARRRWRAGGRVCRWAGGWVRADMGKNQGL
jgi:hypothetical protein